ncbi:Ribosomal protein L47 mitochondrial [Penicillium concentricum]|uniref:Large ribosomal subunit protein uL29m n=1 Tax=Penicillium concentricum TaxID=293559 RepID=A0A9W9S692_9EURO|nr:Ribosomal protein L47 mitochondrial [Penicillium concentricum]KAJ5372811.1 Ribosomal protein L47 mitochondrial [Penicillium concentricum]
MQQVPRIASRLRGLAMAELPPTYLAPSLHPSVTLSAIQTSSFSSTASVGANPRRDKSKNRGVSAINRTGPRTPFTVSRWPLPKPVSPEDMQPRETNPNHGLWGFFPLTGKHCLPQNMTTLMNECSMGSADVSNLGRPWTIQELREKSWEDLHALWHVCVRERNRIVTSDFERERIQAGYGQYESQERDKVVRSTMKTIKHVLRERWYAWEDASRMYKRGYRPEDFYGLDDVEVEQKGNGAAQAKEQ